MFSEQESAYETCISITDAVLFVLLWRVSDLQEYLSVGVAATGFQN